MSIPPVDFNHGLLGDVDAGHLHRARPLELARVDAVAARQVQHRPAPQITQHLEQGVALDEMAEQEPLGRAVVLSDGVVRRLPGHATALLVGTVTDITGGVLDDVRIEAVGPARRTAVTGTDGTFEISGLRPGTYRVTPAREGFGTYEATIKVGNTGSSRRRHAVCLRVAFNAGDRMDQFSCRTGV